MVDETKEIRRIIDDINAKLQTDDVDAVQRVVLESDCKQLTEQLRLIEAQRAAATEPVDVSAWPEVEIDGEGTFKYVLMLCKLPDGSGKYLVRGKDVDYHYNVAIGPLAILANAENVQVEVVGGGRIRHDPVHKEIEIYGYSCQYGQADHSISANLCRDHFGPHYKVYWHNEGY